MPEVRKIVILEDDRTTNRLISGVLEKAGYEVLQAYEGRTAIELVFKERPALFISDVLVPDMNGSEVVKSINKSSFGAELDVLFLTSLLDKGDPDIGEKRLKVEGKEYPALAKPLKPELLLEVVLRIAGAPVIPDPVEAAVEESIEAQEEEANKAVDAAEGEEESSPRSEGETSEEEKAAETPSE